MLTKHLTTIPFRLEAGRELPISKMGNFILCAEADGLFDVKADDHVSLQDFKPGLTFSPDPGEVFHTVTLRNRGKAVVTGVLAVGYGNFGSNATLGAITIDSKSTVKTVSMADDTVVVSQWDTLAAYEWIAISTAPRSAVCILAEGAKLLWRINGIVTAAPWDGIVAPTPDAWLKMAAGFEFCVTSTAKVTMFERLQSGLYDGVGSAIPSPLNGGNGNLLGYYEADAAAIDIPAFQGEAFAMIVGQATFKNAPTGDNQKWSANVLMKLDGVEICRMSNSGDGYRYHTAYADNATQVIGRTLAAGTPHTVSIEAQDIVKEKVGDFKLRVFVYART